MRKLSSPAVTSESSTSSSGTTGLHRSTATVGMPPSSTVAAAAGEALLTAVAGFVVTPIVELAQPFNTTSVEESSTARLASTPPEPDWIVRSQAGFVVGSEVAGEKGTKGPLTWNIGDSLSTEKAATGDANGVIPFDSFSSKDAFFTSSSALLTIWLFLRSTCVSEEDVALALVMLIKGKLEHSGSLTSGLSMSPLERLSSSRALVNAEFNPDRFGFVVSRRLPTQGAALFSRDGGVGNEKSLQRGGWSVPPPAPDSGVLVREKSTRLGC